MADGFSDEATLPCNVRLTVSRELCRETPLNLFVAAGRLAVSAQIVSKGDVLAPQRAAELNEVNMIRPRLAAPEELMTGNPGISPMLIAGALERHDVCERRR